MSKPPGIQYGITASGPYLRVSPRDRVTDAIYDAVEAALDDGWTVEEFRREAASCWSICLAERKRSDEDAWSRR
jgi:hypothetical protein